MEGDGVRGMEVESCHSGAEVRKHERSSPPFSLEMVRSRAPEVGIGFEQGRVHDPVGPEGLAEGSRGSFLRPR